MAWSHIELELTPRFTFKFESLFDFGIVRILRKPRLPTKPFAIRGGGRADFLKKLGDRWMASFAFSLVLRLVLSEMV